MQSTYFTSEIYWRIKLHVWHDWQKRNAYTVEMMSFMIFLKVKWKCISLKINGTESTATWLNRLRRIPAVLPVMNGAVLDNDCDSTGNTTVHFWSVPEVALRSAPWRIHDCSIVDGCRNKLCQAAQSRSSWQEVRQRNEIENIVATVFRSFM